MNGTELSHVLLDDAVAWAEGQPWARAMAACQQDAGWHAEGDVWTHTKMVCAELPRLDEWPALTPRERSLLIFTALFHDAAKPLTSRFDPESGRVRSPQHAVKGEQLARSALRATGCELGLREEICRMVRLHGRPAFLLEKANPAVEVVSLSWRVNNRLLYLFALADTRGRTTAETTRPEENLQLFRLAAEEHGCFDGPYSFGHDHARFHFFRQSEPNLFFVPHDQHRGTVTMVAGPPGGGKDHWLATRRKGVPVVSLDDVREELDIDATQNQGAVVQFARERCREFLRSGTPFAFNATNLLKQTRQRWIDLFADYGARIEIVYVEPPLPRILEQNRRRERPVPERVIHDLIDQAEPPTWTEAHRLVLCDGNTDG